MRITIDGKTMEVPDGANVTVNGNKVTINGTAHLSKNDINCVKIEGEVGSVRVDEGSVTVVGTVRGDVEAGGSVSCGDVGGSVTADGSVSCGDVHKGVTAYGSVSCGDVYGGIGS